MNNNHQDAINALEYLSGEFKEHSSEYKIADHIIKDYYQNHDKDGRETVESFMEPGSKEYFKRQFENQHKQDIKQWGGG